MQSFTPKLKPGTGSKITNFPSHGIWHGRSADELDKLADSLFVQNIDPTYFDIDCIPNMWGCPLLFDMALYDSDHILNERILGEWRGLLAMLAFKELLDLDLKMERVEIPKPDVPDRSDFLKALGRLAPEKTLADDVTWFMLYVILCNTRTDTEDSQGNTNSLWDYLPIGITSPTTLVCTARDYRAMQIVNEDTHTTTTYHSLNGIVGWFNGKYLCDPTGILDQEKRALLAGWLNQLSTKLATRPNINQGMLQNLTNLISNFITDLGGVATIKLSERSLGMDEGIYSYIDKPLYKPKIFTEKLFLISQRNALPGMYNDSLQPQIDSTLGDVTPIIPVNPQILSQLFLSADELIRNTSFTKSANGIVVSLNAGGNVINWEYRNEDIIRKDYPPVLDIWPNFKAPGWNLYYTYYSPSRFDTFKINLSEGDPINYNFKNGFVITETNSFPTKMECIYNDEIVGMLFLPPVEELSRPQGNWVMGVDFGTTATNAYFFNPTRGGDPLPINFEKRLFTVTESGAAHTLVYTEFLGEAEKTPFLSIFQDLERVEGIQLTDMSSIRDGHIYFLNPYHRFRAIEDDICTNLKWSDDPSVRARTRAFLGQLYLQCVAEAVAEGIGTIEWRFSYPTAFSVKEQEEIMDIWTRNMGIYNPKTGIRNKNDENSEVKALEMEPESVASARFFSNNTVHNIHGPFGSAAACLDIGGATSDISIWQNNNLLWETSLRLAGRDIFLKPIHRKLDILREFNVDVVDLEEAKNEPPAFFAQAEALIGEHSDAILNALPTLGPRPIVSGFIQLIATALSGIYYYTGLMIRYLYESKNAKKLMPSVYVAGNGSRMFHWLASGTFTQDKAINHLFKDVLLKASNITINKDMFNLRISPVPKAEAAFGLVYRKSNLICSSNIIKEDNVIAGESFIESGKSMGWNEILTAAKLSKGLNAPATYNDLNILKDFIDTFNTYARSPNSVVRPINISDSKMNTIYSGLTQYLTESKGIDPERIHVEPLFIRELKVLLEVMIDEWAK